MVLGVSIFKLSLVSLLAALVLGVPAMFFVAGMGWFGDTFTERSYFGQCLHRRGARHLFGHRRLSQPFLTRPRRRRDPRVFAQRTRVLIVQSYSAFGEPYRVSFYMRDKGGVWRWAYLEHEDLAWRSAEVRFTTGVATVFRNGRPFSTIPLLP